MFLTYAFDGSKFWAAGILGALIYQVFFGFIPLTARRLQDINQNGKSAFLLLIFSLIPGINMLIILFLLIRKGTLGSNQYGEESKNTWQGLFGGG